jgi:hypothetical protein
MNLKEKGCEDMDWIHLILGRTHERDFVSIVIKRQVPLKTENFLNG